MGLETATYISGLVATNPINATDVVGEGDDHLRLIKSTLLNSFPGITGAMTLTHTQLNAAAIKSEANIFTASEQRIRADQPTWWFEETDAGANAGHWRLIAAAEAFYLQAADDAEAVFSNPLAITRSGSTVTNIQLRASSEVGLINGTNLAIYDSDNNSYLVADHDGTDFNYLYANTTAVNYGGTAHCFSPVASHGVNQRLLTVYDSASAGVVASFESASTSFTLVDLDNTNASPTYGAQIRFNLAGTTKSVIGFSPNTGAAAHIHMANGHTANPHHTFYVEGSGYYNLQGGGIRVYDSLNSSALEIKHQSAAIIDLTGIGSTTNIYTNCSLAMRSGAGVYTYDAGNTKYARMLHNGTEGYLDTNSGSFYIAPASGITYFFTSGTQAKIRAYNSGGTAYGDFYYDGTYVYLDHSTGSGLNTLSLSLTTNNDTADEPGYKGVPQLAKTTSYPLVLADAGKCVYLTGSTASQTVTIPANASVAFPIGTVIEIISDSTVNWSIAITTDTLEQLGTGATGTRTLAPDGKAVLEKVTATKWKISGINLG